MTAENQAAVADSPDDGAVTGRRAIPRARHVVPRRRLHERLDSANDTPITLISAPAGSGKTLLTASWLAATGDDHAAWVTVQPGEADSHIFWHTVAAALAEVVADALRTQLYAAARDSMPAAEETPARLASLINKNPDPILLLLDNLHDVSDADIHHGLLQLLSYTSGNLRAIVMTRHDPPWPLHRLHLDGMLHELRAADLAFDADEAAALFAQMTVPVTPDQLARLLTRTEGWAAGLRLAALGVSGATDPAQFIDEFSGDEYSVADYLLREVFDKQTPDWQDFLIRISIVDEVCGDLADVLTGGDDGAERLTRLAETNMFVHALGRSGHWYRLHHLLVDFLTGRLTDPRLRRDLDRRAAEWFRSRDMPWPALRYALAGGHWGLAADLVSIHVFALVARQSPGQLEALLAPLPMEVLLVHPGLAIGLAAARAIAGDLTQVDQLTDSVRSHLPQLTGQRRRRFEVVLGALDIAPLRLTGDLDRALEACRRVPTDPVTLAGLGLQSWDIVRSVVLSNMGTMELWIGDLLQAREHLGLAVQPGLQEGMLIPRLNAQAHSALLDWIQGDLNRATQTAQRTIAELSQAGMPFLPQGVCAYLALAGVATDRGELDAAHQWLDLARGAAIEPHVILALAVMRARCGVLQADLRNDATMPMARLRRAAVKWLRAHGRPDEAVRLAITGGDWSAAASIVVNDLAIARLLVRPGGQVDAVLPPASPRTRANPQVGVARAAAAVAASDFGAAKAHLARVRRDVKWQGTSYQPAIELCTAVVEIALANAQENWADVLAGVDEVEKMLAEQAPIRRTRVSELHAFILWQKGVALLWSADDMVAGAACLRSAAVAADSANFVPVGMNCLGLLALLEILEGNPQRAERLATTAARMAQQLDREDEFHPAAVEVALAWAKAQQSDLPAAQRHADRASTSLPECPDRIAAAVLAVVNARLQVRQHHACSGNARSASDSRALSEPLPSWLKARLISARDHFFAPAVARVRGIPRLPHVDGIHPRMNGVADGLAKSAAAPVMTGRSAGRAAGATDHVPAPSWPGKSHNQEIAALEPAIIEPLTDREMEVLEKLSAHYSTEEIAEAMFISVNTVRTHVRDILRKLSAPRRQQAVRVARRLQLIA